LHFPRVELASLLINEGDADGAEAALAGCPLDNVAATTVLGFIATERGQLARATEAFAAARRLSPGYYPAEHEFAASLLRAGDWPAGFAAYEGRREWGQQRNFRDVPRWDGGRVRRLLVWTEQGQGDSINFARYLPFAAERAERVTFAVDDSLRPLF